MRTRTPEELVAKPTLFRHVMTRSLLEARWLCFFSALGIRWEYEPAPVTLHGRPRWPDCWLPDLGCWLEIKPAGMPLDADMALALAEQTGSPLLWLSGEPWLGRHRITYHAEADREPVSGLVWALGRRDAQELWLLGVAPPTAIRLLPKLDGPLTWENAQGLEWPRPDAAALKAAFREASIRTFEEHP